jgi:hypothetical protein
MIFLLRGRRRRCWAYGPPRSPDGARDGLLKPAVHTPGGHRRYRRGEVLAVRTANTTERQFEEDAARLYGQGWPIRRVAAEFGVSYGLMRRILLKQTALRNRGGREQ